MGGASASRNAQKNMTNCVFSQKWPLLVVICCKCVCFVSLPAAQIGVASVFFVTPYDPIWSPDSPRRSQSATRLPSGRPLILLDVPQTLPHAAIGSGGGRVVVVGGDGLCGVVVRCGLWVVGDGWWLVRGAWCMVGGGL